MKQLKRLRKTIKKIKEKTGWSTLKVLKRLGRAYKYGITPTDYLKNNCYKKKRKDLEKLGKKLQKRNLAIKETMINRKMTKKEATKLVKEAHDLGFTYSRYLNNKVWEFNSDELPEAKEALDKIKKRDIYYREYYEKVAAKKTGWKVEKVKEEMAKARKKGHYSLSYIRYSLYLLKDEEIANKKLEENKLTEEEIKIKEEHERERKEHIAEIMKEKNWTLGRYRIEFLKAKYNAVTATVIKINGAAKTANPAIIGAIANCNNKNIPIKTPITVTRAEKAAIIFKIVPPIFVLLIAVIIWTTLLITFPATFITGVNIKPTVINKALKLSFSLARDALIVSVTLL